MFVHVDSKGQGLQSVGCWDRSWGPGWKAVYTEQGAPSSPSGWCFLSFASWEPMFFKELLASTVGSVDQSFLDVLSNGLLCNSLFEKTKHDAVKRMSPSWRDGRTVNSTGCFSRDQSSVPGTSTMHLPSACNFSSRGPDILSWPSRVLIHIAANVWESFLHTHYRVALLQYFTSWKWRQFSRLSVSLCLHAPCWMNYRRVCLFSCVLGTERWQSWCPCGLSHPPRLSLRFLLIPSTVSFGEQKFDILVIQHQCFHASCFCPCVLSTLNGSPHVLIPSPDWNSLHSIWWLLVSWGSRCPHRSSRGCFPLLSLPCPFPFPSLLSPFAFRFSLPFLSIFTMLGTEHWSLTLSYFPFSSFPPLIFPILFN